MGIKTEKMEDQKIMHRVFGEGVVIDQRHRGHELLVCFSNSLRLWVKKNDLTPFDTSGHIDDKDSAFSPISPSATVLSSPAPSPALPSSPSPSTTIHPPKPIQGPLVKKVSEEGRSVIEAFRLGIVPIKRIKEWTVGRVEELDTVQCWLEDESSGTMVIRGEYGSGKSHLIEYLNANGFELNYAVSMVGINPCDAQPGFPKRVYRHLIKNIRFPYEDHYLNLNEMLTLIGKNVQKNPLSDHHFLGRLMQHIMKNRDTPEMWEWIEGQDTPFDQFGVLYDHTTAANLYCNILNGLSTLAVRLLGLRGLLLMFDEAETSRTYRYTYEWTRALNFFNALSMVANDEPELMEESVVRGNSYYYGNKTGLVYSGLLSLPYLYQMPSYLKVAFAFTPDYKLNLYQDHNIYEVHLETLSVKQMEYLFYKFTALYETVYRTRIPLPDRRHLFEGIRQNSYQSTRRFIKSMVECLDFYRFYPSEPLNALFAYGSPKALPQF